MFRADYKIVKVTDTKVFLIDLDLGSKSVTNDAERVYDEVNEEYPNHRIVYRDSVGRWDEMIKTNRYDVTFRAYL